VTVCGNGYRNGNPSTFQSQFAFTGNPPSATGSTGASHSTWLSYRHRTIAPEIFPVGNPAQHKTPQSYRGVANAYAWAGLRITAK